MSAANLPWFQATMAALPPAPLPPDEVARLGCTLAQRLEGSGSSESLADLRGLGAVLYRALTGQVAPTPALRRHLPESPRALCGIIALLMQNDPPRGYRSMAGVQADLQLAAQLMQSGRPHDTFSLARRDPAMHAA